MEIYRQDKETLLEDSWCTFEKLLESEYNKMKVFSFSDVFIVKGLFIWARLTGLARFPRSRPWPVWNTSTEIHGNLWKSMEFHGNRWKSMEFHGTSMECHAVPWIIHRVPWNAMEFHEVLMEVHGISWNIVEVHGMPWGSLKCRWSPMECHNVCMEFDRIPCSLYERIHRNSVIKQLVNLLTTCSSLHFLLDRKIGNIWTLSKSKIVRLV